MRSVQTSDDASNDSEQDDDRNETGRTVDNRKIYIIDVQVAWSNVIIDIKT